MANDKILVPRLLEEEEREERWHEVVRRYRPPRLPERPFIPPVKPYYHPFEPNPGPRPPGPLPYGG